MTLLKSNIISAKISLLLTISLQIILTGCASPPETSELVKVKSPRFFTIEKNTHRTLGKGTIEQGLLLGPYQSTYENNMGTFFQGPALALYQKDLPNGKVWVYAGGVWIPKSRDLKPRLYFVNGPLNLYPTLESAQQAVDKLLSEQLPVQDSRQFTGYNPTAMAIANQATTNPKMGKAGPIAPTAVGGALGSLVVDLMIAAENGNHALLGKGDNDNDLQAKLEAITQKLRDQESFR
jgi:hypothetical protein